MVGSKKFQARIVNTHRHVPGTITISVTHNGSQWTSVILYTLGELEVVALRIQEYLDEHKT